MSPGKFASAGEVRAMTRAPADSSRIESYDLTQRSGRMEPLDVGQIIDQAPIGAFQIGIFTVCVLVAMLDGFDTQSVAFVAPLIIDAWGLSSAALGTLFSATLLGSALGAVAFGRLADRYGRRAVMALGVGLFGLMTLGCAASNGAPSLLLWRALAGVGLGGAIPALLAFVSEYAPARARATWVVVAMWGYPAGGALGGLLSARLIESFGWRSVFLAGGLLPILLVPLIVTLLPESIRYLAGSGHPQRIAQVLARLDRAQALPDNAEYRVVAPPGCSAPLRSVLLGPFAAATYLLGGSLSLGLLLSYLLVNWLPVLLGELGLPLADSILAAVVLNVSGIVGGFVLCRLMDRGHRDVKIMIAGFLMAAGAAAALGRFGTSREPMLVSVAIVGFFLIGSQMSLTAYTAAYYPPMLRATGLGVTQALGRLGSVLGPLMGGLLLASHVSAEQLLRLGALPTVLVALLLLVLSRLRRPDAPQTPRIRP
jgi:MFS transporter, AAHS family, 4-hydroxybenzoate transporter